MADQVIERDSLGPLTKLRPGWSRGCLSGAPNVKTQFATSMVFKEYKPRSARRHRLHGSIRYACSGRRIAVLQGSGKTDLNRSLAMRHRQRRHGTGRLRDAVDSRKFLISLTTVKGVSQTAAELQHLLNERSVLAARGIEVDDAQRYALLREVASALTFLHDIDVCVGDISPKNMLFALTPREAVYFIDCDAMRIKGISALPQAETPGWEVPPGEELATIYSDTYKLGLLALRLVAGDQDTRSPKRIPSATPNLLRQIITDTLTKEPERRPLPAAWSYVLGHAVE